MPARKKPSSPDTAAKLPENWGASNEEVWPIERLVPYARNARKHSDEQIERLAQRIQKHGFQARILVKADGTIGAGHARVMALKKLGHTHVPVMIAPATWTDQDFREFVLSDNQLALMAEWDDDIRAIEMAELAEMGSDLELLGFDDKELADLLDDADEPAGKTDPDEVPETFARAPITRPGDVWVLGRHRIACGEAKDRAAVEAALAGVEPGLFLTQVPAGAAEDGSLEAALAAFTGVSAYAWCDWMSFGAVEATLEAARLPVAAQLVAPMRAQRKGGGHYREAHRVCAYGVRRSKNAGWRGQAGMGTLWAGEDLGKSESEDVLPVAILERCLKNSSSPGQAVFDPFASVGSSLIAGERTGRSVHAVTASAVDVDKAVERWRRHTGGEATRDGDEASFGALSASQPGTAA